MGVLKRNYEGKTPITECPFFERYNIAIGFALVFNRRGESIPNVYIYVLVV